jgi:hypothetical protein
MHAAGVCVSHLPLAWWSDDTASIIRSGVIAGMPKEKQVWLKPGDVIVSSIEKLGELKFTLG